jgi:hypothetical protein
VCVWYQDCNNRDKQDWKREGSYYYALYNGAKCVPSGFSTPCLCLLALPLPLYPIPLHGLCSHGCVIEVSRRLRGCSHITMWMGAVASGSPLITDFCRALPQGGFIPACPWVSCTRHGDVARGMVTLLAKCAHPSLDLARTLSPHPSLHSALRLMLSLSSLCPEPPSLAGHAPHIPHPGADLFSCSLPSMCLQRPLCKHPLPCGSYYRCNGTWGISVARSTTPVGPEYTDRLPISQGIPALRDDTCGISYPFLNVREPRGAYVRAHWQP